MSLGKNFGLCITPQIFGQTAALSRGGSRFSSLVSPRLYLERLGGKRLERCNRSSSNEVLILTLGNNTKQKQLLERFTGH